MYFPCPLCCTWQCNDCGWRKTNFRWRLNRYCPKCRGEGTKTPTFHRDLDLQVDHLAAFLDSFKKEVANK